MNFKNYLIRFTIITILLKISLNRKTLYIPGVTLNTHLDSSLIQLPYEAPTLIINNLTQILGTSERIQNISIFFNKYINSIGYLPPVEQSALIYSINERGENNSNIFDRDKYKEYMNTIIDNGEFKETRYQNVQRSLLEYAKKNQLRIPIGLGCLLKIGEQYGTKNDKENSQLLQSITNSIDTILEAQLNVIEKENEFILDMTEQLNQKKLILFNITWNDLNILIENKEYEDKYLIDNVLNKIKYGRDFDVNSLIELMKAKSSFNKILSKQSLLIQVNIGLLDGCMQTGKSNENAGISSYEGSPIRVKKKGEYVAHNYANGTRSDRKTQNGYNLNFGFGLGKEKNSGVKPYKNLIPYSTYKYINGLKNVSSLMNSDSRFLIHGKHLSDILNNFNQFDNIATYLFKNVLLLNPNSSSEINYNNYFSSSNAKINDVYSISCENIVDNCSIWTNGTINSTVIYSINPSSNFLNFYSVMGYFESNSFIVSYGKNSQGKLIYEMYYNGYNIFSKQSEFTEISNACFGVFYSGGKNDKDTCRNVFKEKCGNELDYRCKESGFYDIMTENPASNYDYPLDCQDQISKKCLAWVDKHIIGGGLVIKPSSLMSLSLLIQKYGEIEDNNINENIFGNESYNDDGTMDFDIVDYSDISKNDLNVEMKKTVYYQVNYHKGIKVNFWVYFLFLTLIGVL